MCLPLRETDPVIAEEAPKAQRRAAALFTLIVLAGVSDELRPEVTFRPGMPVEVAPAPPHGATSAPPTYPTWRPR